MINPVARVVLVFLVVLGGMACAGKPPVLTINERQTLVMDASLLTAGITASKPDLSRSSSGATATATVSNATTQAVTLHYRFYWYDASGLDVLPAETELSVVIPAQGEIRLSAAHPSQDIHQVRLHLFL